MNRDKLLKNVSVLDTETTNLHAEKSEIVEIAGARYDGANWQVDSMLLGAIDGIPPEASAKNHISNKMIKGLPTFKDITNKVKRIIRWNENDDIFYVAHNCKYDQDVLAKAWKDANSFSDVDIAKDPMKWICTFRLAKQVLDFDFDDMQYSLSYLRYRFDLPVPDDTSTHRAAGDTLTCAVLFEFLIDYALATGKATDGEDLHEQIFVLCWQPLFKKKWPFGKHRGQPLTSVPTDYYVWALKTLDSLNEKSSDFDPDLAESVRIVLEERFK